ncbi:MAG: NAD-dependent epimerase/dehydratase family protein [candidate division Zixibacteria bacterium]|nr:NAD-dependent epimerase/dehydratase family protein [candidate division Zixibacteria bacterium]
MIVIVTGGAGFIGSHLCTHLVNEGNEVVCIDNFYTGMETNLEHIADNPHFKLIRHDIIEPIELRADRIYNLACPASPVHYQADPIRTIKTSVFGALNMLEFARKNSARMLQASTSEIYGDPHEQPQTEHYWGNVNPVGIRSCYDEGKRLAETMCFEYKRQYSADIRVARIFNTYGPRMAVDDGRVVPNLINQALKGQSLTVYGDGSQTRSFCYIDDMVDGLIRLMESDYSESPVNLGNPLELSILDVVELIQKLTGIKGEVVFRKLPEDDPARRKPDISLARRVLNWNPKVSIEKGMRETIEYFRQEPHIGHD